MNSGQPKLNMDRDHLSWTQGELRIQCGDDLLGPRPEHAARPHAALVALEPAPRSRSARTRNLLGRTGCLP